MHLLMTGCAGFIGWRVSKKLLEEGHQVVGIDNLNDYYDVRLKQYRLEDLKAHKNFTFYQGDIENLEFLEGVFKKYPFDGVINEAARAGVRASLQNPFVYFTDLPVNTPISPYAASKKSAEVIAYTYHYLYGIDVSVVRYFTVYGPAGRPDMSVFRFIKWIMEEKPLEVFGDGSQSRDFTYIDDIAEGTILALKPLGYEIINLGNNQPHKLSEVIRLIEKFTGKTARVENREFHKADLKATWADITKAKELLGWQPKVSLEEGIRRTVDWFKENWHWLKEIKL
jgi:UDP-glucuronate 4-epimerase